MTTKLQDNGINEFFDVLSRVVPIPNDPKKIAQIEALTGGQKLEKIIPQFINIFKLMVKQNKDSSEMWFRFFKQGIDFMDGTTNHPPDIEMPSGYDTMKKVQEIQKKK